MSTLMEWPTGFSANPLRSATTVGLATDPSPQPKKTCKRSFRNSGLAATSCQATYWKPLDAICTNLHLTRELITEGSPSVSLPEQPSHPQTNRAKLAFLTAFPIAPSILQVQLPQNRLSTRLDLVRPSFPVSPSICPMEQAALEKTEQLEPALGLPVP